MMNSRSRLLTTGLTLSLASISSRLSIFNGPPPKPAAGKAGQWFTIRNAASGTEPVEILIYDQIGKDWWTGDGIEASVFAEALKKIPMDREILLRVNSPGGSVRDGIAIYNLLSERRDRIVGQVDSQAASIASVIVLAGREVRMPENALLMIHDPWAGCVGSAKDMRKAAEVLDKHRDAIALAYQRKTGASALTVKAWMEAETWFTAAEAKANRFADVVTDEQVAAMACSGFAQFKKLPQSIRARIRSESTSEPSAPASSSSSAENQICSSASSESSEMPDSDRQPTAASGGQPQKQKDTMNRDKIIAMLKKRGIKVDDKATEEQLLTQLDEALAQRSNGADGEGGATGGEGAQASDPETEPVNRIKGKSKKAPAQEAPLDNQSDSGAETRALRADVDQFKARFEGERKQRITAAVQQCVNEDRIPQAQAPAWIDRVIKDEKILDDLRDMAPKPPGAPPAGIVITGESPEHVAQAMKAQRKPMESFLKGNDISGKSISDAAIATSKIIALNRKQLDVILAANTIDPTLKRTVVLNATVSVGFQR